MSLYEPDIKRLIYYLLIASRGAPKRLKILKYLKENPANANQLAQVLNLDYKTIMHHLRILEVNGLVVQSSKGSYGSVYFVSPIFEGERSILEEIWAKLNKQKDGGIS